MVWMIFWCPNDCRCRAWGFLDWKEPVDGGAVASYKIEHSERPAGSWSLISVALESEAILNNEERNKDC